MPGESSILNPAISVILPVYNGGAYLVSSLESVLSQSFKNFELLVLDDGSTDNSWQYLNSVDDARMVLHKNRENKGLFYNLNFLIAKCKSNYIKLWAQDDIMYPDCLQGFVDFYREHAGTGFAYCGNDNIDENGIVKKSGPEDHTAQLISSDLHARIAFFTGSIAGNISNVCISREALNKVGGFNENMKISADFDMWVRLAKEHTTGFIRAKLIQLRDHSGQLSRNEKYYINHIKEDLMVYRNLLSYVNADTKKQGKIMLRNHKFVFYYTLMVKALMKGKVKTAFQFYKQLSSMDNFFKLSVSFVKAKISKPSVPDF